MSSIGSYPYFGAQAPMPRRTAARRRPPVRYRLWQEFRLFDLERGVSLM